jgi:2',3'-cyclic-nucleotide 2'-phosphodiesterase (5'-nucleotidase family)
MNHVGRFRARHLHRLSNLAWPALVLPLALACPWPAAAAAETPASTLTILSTTDVKGKTSPCGCHTPKGGFARRAGFADSVRKEGPAVLIVDSGGFFPHLDDYEPVANFVAATMKLIGTDAAGLGDRELRYGRAFLLATLERTGLPVVCANLLDAKTRQPLVAPSLIKKVGRTKVGIFGLMSDKVDLGPSRDSLAVLEPREAARRTVDQLRRQGATVIVLLSQLGKVESEDLAAAVDGIDLVVAGRSVPLYQKGRMIKNTVIGYGGEESHYMGRSRLELDARGRMLSGTNEMVMLGPEVAEKPATLALVKEFEDSFNEAMRQKDKQRAAAAAARSGSGATTP